MLRLCYFSSTATARCIYFTVLEVLCSSIRTLRAPYAHIAADTSTVAALQQLHHSMHKQKYNATVTLCTKYLLQLSADEVCVSFDTLEYECIHPFRLILPTGSSTAFKVIVKPIQNSVNAVQKNFTASEQNVLQLLAYSVKLDTL
jgi:hypothetical protein